MRGIYQQYSNPGDSVGVVEQEINRAINRVERILKKPKEGQQVTSEIRLQMQHTMQQYGAVFRQEDTLLEGKNKMRELAKEMNNLWVNDKVVFSIPI